MLNAVRMVGCIFFFSSRRRHTRFDCDWSSDVCSSDLEGRPSRDYRHTKALMHSDTGLWHRVMERLADSAIAFLDVQLSHGAGAFQLFDSWAGTLSRGDYERFVLPHSRHVFAELAARHPDAPGIHF